MEGAEAAAEAAPVVSASVSKVLLDAMNRSIAGTPPNSPARITEEAGALSKLQRTFAALGFYDPATRFISMFVISSVCVMALRPWPIYKKDGKINDQSYLQWWMPGLFIGAASAFFV